MNTLPIPSKEASLIRLFRVYSPFYPRKEARVWAHTEDEAKKQSISIEPALKRYPNLKALPI